MRLICKGRHDALECLYHRHGRRVLAFLRVNLYRDKSRAEDLLQDLFAMIWAKPYSYNSERTFTTWLFACANNLLKNEIRYHTVRDKYHVDDEIDSLADGDGYMDGHAGGAEYRFDMATILEMVERCLGDVSSQHQATFHLRYVEELSVPEIAVVLDIPEGTVKSRLHKVVQTLAGKMKQYQ